MSERTCKNCFSEEIEDETHFLCVCTKFITKRNILFNLVAKKYPRFSSLSNESKLIFLLSNEDTDILAATARFILDRDIVN